MSEQELIDADKVWSLLGKRWTIAILQRLDIAGVLRFTELKRSLDGISGTILSERLLDLEDEGLVTKEVHSSVPPKVEYRLTASAKELALIMNRSSDGILDGPPRMTCVKSRARHPVNLNKVRAAV